LSADAQPLLSRAATIASLVVVALALGSSHVFGRPWAAAMLFISAVWLLRCADRTLGAALCLVALLVLVPQLPISVSLLMASVAAVVVSVLRGQDGYLSKFAPPSLTLLALGTGLGLAAATAITLWFNVASPLYARVNVPLVAGFALPLALVAAVLAIGNSISEELFWRVISLNALHHSFSLHWAIALQAVAFGVMHYYGFPSGLSGVLLAVLFGMLTGLLTAYCGNIWPALTSHVIADVSVLMHLLAE
jgi:hypothetical protein